MNSTPREPERQRRRRVADAIEACVSDLDMPYNEVARKAGISESGLRNIRQCRNRANPRTLRDLSLVFERPPNYLETIRDTEPPQSPKPFSVAERTLQEIVSNLVGVHNTMTAILDRLDRIETKIDQHDLP